MHRRRRRHRHQTLSPAAPDGSTISRWEERKRRKLLLCQEQRGEEGYAGPTLTEDIWCHIHSLLPLRDAACVSHAFLWSWRNLPNLSFSEESLGLLYRKPLGKKGISREFTRKVDDILKNHSGTGVKTFELRMPSHYKARDDHHRINTWLQVAAKPGIEKVTLSMSSKDGTYELPSSFLSNGKGGSIRHLQLASCSLCPPATPWSLRNLTILDLKCVQFKGGGLWGLLSSSTVLERLSLKNCSGIVCLKIPGSLRRLGYLEVSYCDDLQAVESKAPNLSIFHYEGDLDTQISLGEALRVKNLHLDCPGYACYTRAELASNSRPDFETVDVLPSRETLDQHPETSSKSAHLERLYIAWYGITPFYMNTKYCALVSPFGASHSVEDFISHVSGQLADHVKFCSALRGSQTSTWSAEMEERMVEEACCMLKAWLS